MPFSVRSARLKGRIVWIAENHDEAATLRRDGVTEIIFLQSEVAAIKNPLACDDVLQLIAMIKDVNPGCQVLEVREPQVATTAPPPPLDWTRKRPRAK